jgi:glucokinase
VEAAIWASLRRTYGRVSIERLLSGPGLYALYRGLADVRGVAADLKDEKEVLAAGQAGGDLLAEESLDRFCEILGSVAGDIALTCGARGGVYVSGGMAPRMADRLAAGGFRRRFEDKGRLSDYTRDIPTHLVVHPFAALVGAARVLEQMEGSLL